MSVLDTIITGKTPQAPRILIFGYEGVGKSTWAAQAPKPIFIQTEEGLNQIDTSKFPLAKSLADVKAQLIAIRDEPHDFQTLVIDSLSGLEPLVWKVVCDKFGVKVIERVEGGFGRGYRIATETWQEILSLLGEINEKRNMMIIMIAHVGVQEVKNPETATYDRTAPRLQKAAEATVSQWCDCVFQAKQKFRLQKIEGGFGNDRMVATAVGADGGERVLRTIGNAAVIAKNRYNLPEEIPLDFKVFLELISKEEK